MRKFLKNLFRSKYAVSLVYLKANHEKAEIDLDIILVNTVVWANTENEALGTAINEVAFEETKGYQLTNKSILKV
jgi:hypothetical protein